MAAIWGGAVSYERGTPVAAQALPWIGNREAVHNPHAKGPMVVLERGAVFYERGTPVQLSSERGSVP